MKPKMTEMLGLVTTIDDILDDLIEDSGNGDCIEDDDDAVRCLDDALNTLRGMIMAHVRE